MFKTSMNKASSTPFWSFGFRELENCFGFRHSGFEFIGRIRSSLSSYFIYYWLCLTVLLLLLAACGSTPPPPKTIPSTGYHPPKRTSTQTSPSRQKQSAPYVVQGKRYYPLASSSGFAQKGMASWYGRKFHGRLTANGERYNMYGRTAAHKTLPFNTYLRVTNLRNGRQTVVRINDRGPFVRGRIIDLTYTSAKELRLAEEGVVPVRIEALGYARKKRKDGKLVRVYVKPESYQLGDFTIQVGAFANRDNARKLHATLTRKYGRATVQIANNGNQKLYRVRVGRYTRLNSAQEAVKKLQMEGFPTAIVVARDE
jgi:rare lipoprotein A